MIIFFFSILHTSSNWKKIESEKNCQMKRSKYWKSQITDSTYVVLLEEINSS